MRDQTRRLVLATLLFVTAATTLVVDSHADARFCAHCNRSDFCEKTCRLVCEQKKVTITCWGTKDEDFCVPGPSCLAAKHCETVCDTDSDPKAPCVQPKNFAWNEWMPGTCAKVFTKKKLMKRTITKSIPSFKWVVEDLCPDCLANCENPPVPAGTKLPPIPDTNAQIVTPALEPAPAPVKADETKPAPAKM